MDLHDARERARQVAAVAREHRDEGERGRRLAPPVVSAVEGSGLPALVLPSALGGEAAEPSTLVEVIETIARDDASTAWCTGIGSGSNFLSALIDESAAREIFTDVTRGGAGPFAPTGKAEETDSGYRVTGRWPYSSNCQQAAVIAAGIFAFRDGRPSELRDGAPVARLGFFTADQLEIDETWNTVGLRATGSHDMFGTDIALPRERTCTLFDAMWPDDPLFRLRTFDVLGACLSSVPLGIGRAALDVVAAKAVADAELPPAMGPRPHFGDDLLAQVELGRAETRLRAAKALLLDALDTSYAHAVAGDTPPRAATAVIGLANCEALAAGAYAVDVAVRLLGSASVREGGPLERLRRDVDTAGAHVMFSPRVMVGLSRELAGLPTTAFPYLPPPD
jgi:alkylation response protein AidB-like acyl-CoA dehydrogenase